MDDGVRQAKESRVQIASDIDYNYTVNFENLEQVHKLAVLVTEGSRVPFRRCIAARRLSRMIDSSLRLDTDDTDLSYGWTSHYPQSINDLAQIITTA